MAQRTPFLLSLVAASLAACSGGPAIDDRSTTPDGAALDAPSRDGTTEDIVTNDLVSADSADGGTCRNTVCNSVCCRAGELCRYDTCVADLGRCTAPADPDAGVDASVDGGTTEDRCPSDSYCDAMGYCTPYGVPAARTRDETCRSRAIPAPLVPATQCSWETRGINGTPVVADLRIGPRAEFEYQPSIVVAVNDTAGSPYVAGGHIYIFDGNSGGSATCRMRYALTDPSQLVASAGTPAIGDLDGDGRPEIVAPRANGGVIVFRYDLGSEQFVTAWSASTPVYTAGSPSIVDLTGDGHPEVVLAGHVFAYDGAVIADTPTPLTYQGYAQPVVLADVDLDGEIEMVANNSVYQLDAPMNRWVRESYDMATASQGFDAVADFGEFPGRRGDAPGRPEIVHYAGNRLIIRTIGGDTVLDVNAAAVAGGGPPAVADIDGDGLPEVVVAGRAMMGFDIDCAATPRPGGRCSSGLTNGVLWTQSNLRDGSSAINGVTVFDFDGDNRSEIVEADECFVRIFDGRSGLPRWSAPRVSCTFIEMPIVADTDGDFSAEIVVGANQYCGSECGMATGAPDPILPGFACSSSAACPIGSECLGGLCRCGSTADCGAGNTCTPPLTADGMGNVCRSTYSPTVGLKVYGDARNRWVPSRPIWNEYGYSITNVNDDGTIPARAARRNNWQIPGLNDYRRNTQGALGDQTAPNLTIAPSPGGCVAGAGGAPMLEARFCNRGTGVAGAMSSIQFDAVTASGTRTPICTASAAMPIGPGTCVDVRCTGTAPLPAGATVEAVADANDQVQECREGDNRRVIYRPEDCIL